MSPLTMETTTPWLLAVLMAVGVNLLDGKPAKGEWQARLRFTLYCFVINWLSGRYLCLPLLRWGMRALE